jgi:hypothetical protein
VTNVQAQYKSFKGLDSGNIPSNVVSDEEFEMQAALEALWRMTGASHKNWRIAQSSMATLMELNGDSGDEVVEWNPLPKDGLVDEDVQRFFNEMRKCRFNASAPGGENVSCPTGLQLDHLC